MTQHRSKKNRHSERGIALLIAIFTVLLITAIGAAMIMLTNTETSISSNYRDEQKAFFDAKAGMEEIRDRFRGGANNSLAANLPAVLPGNANAFLYVTNPKNAGDNVTPWVTNGNAYPDREICVEMTNMGTPCAGNPPVPPGGVWYTTSAASASYQMTPKADWKWTRINLKTNGTSSGTAVASRVDPNFAANALVCWNGASEIATNLANCSAVNPNYLPVYVMTTQAVTPTGSRRTVQAEAVRISSPRCRGQ